MAENPPEARYLPRAALYLLKFVLWEPFRWGERAFGPPTAPLPHGPVVVLGYYRSGTTHLQEVLLQDRRFGYMNFYQGYFPTAFNSTEAWVKPVFERIIRASGFLHPAHGVPFGFDLPAEDDVALTAAGFRLAANWGQIFPDRFRELYGRTGFCDAMHPDDEAEFVAVLNDLLWRVSRANGHRRLLLKSPPHTGRLGLLARIWPDARFVFIRRDPRDVFASNLGLWRSFEGQHLRAPRDPAAVREHIAWSHDRAHTNYERDRELLAPGRLVELTYEDLLADPLGQLARIYGGLGLDGFDEVRPAFAAYLARVHRPEPPVHALSEHDRAFVDRWLGPWRARWGYAGGSQVPADPLPLAVQELP